MVSQLDAPFFGHFLMIYGWFCSLYTSSYLLFNFLSLYSFVFKFLPSLYYPFCSKTRVLRWIPLANWLF